MNGLHVVVCSTTSACGDGVKYALLLRVKIANSVSKRVSREIRDELNAALPAMSTRNTFLFATRMTVTLSRESR